MKKVFLVSAFSGEHGWRASVSQMSDRTINKAVKECALILMKRVLRA